MKRKKNPTAMANLQKALYTTKKEEYIREVEDEEMIEAAHSNKIIRKLNKLSTDGIYLEEVIDCVSKVYPTMQKIEERINKICGRQVVEYDGDGIVLSAFVNTIVKELNKR